MRNGKAPTILVAEDEPEVRNYLDTALRCLGYPVLFAEDGEEALTCLARPDQDISLVLLDLMMPRKDGLETLREIRQIDRELPVIMFSGMSAPLNVVEAVKCGATDFLAKPVSYDDLGRAIERALRSIPGWAPDAEDQAEGSSSEQPFFLGNARMKEIEAALKKIAASDAPVLFQGESGVGKEVLARELHALSPRVAKPFLKLNCAAMPLELLESELFGYEKGAFTGAFKSKPGKFELAEGGTILLDEIGDMDFKLQAKLLQVLQDHEFQRLGGKETVRVNVRVLAATHCDLEKAMQEDRFREDLYYRLNVINIHVPPLRERQDEIMPLARFFLKKHAMAGANPPEITSVLKKALLAHDWPGNIRELENIMRNYLVFRAPDALAEELRLKTRRKEAPAPAPASAAAEPHPAGPQAPYPPPAATKIAEASRQAETEVILAALNATKWNRKRAAKLLNMDYQALRYKMKKLAIEDEAASPLAWPAEFPIAEPAPLARGPVLPRGGQPAKAAKASDFLASLPPARWRPGAVLPGAPASKPEPPAVADHQTSVLDKARIEVESDVILAALQATHWNRKQAAALLNLGYRALLHKMKRLSLG